MKTVGKMYKKITFFIISFISFAISIFPQENKEQNWFQKHYNNKIYLGYYSSYFDDNIQLLQGGYEGVLRLIDIKPNFNLLDIGIGLNGIIAYDIVNEIQTDNWGHERPKNGRTTYGFELNWNVRVFLIPIPKINARIYAEGCGMSLVVYSREFPETGTHVNIGTNIGIGIEYPINNYKAFTTLKWYHTSNGDVYENNPGLNTAGIIIGLQF
jgi:hypothetical protein